LSWLPARGASCVIELDGSITVLADNYQGKRLNSPNDVVPFRLARLTADESLALTVPPPPLMGA
jgi:hypothetical protein